MIFVLAFGGCFGWFVHVDREAQIQRDAVTAITNVGGSALYDCQFEGSKLTVK